MKGLRRASLSTLVRTAKASAIRARFGPSLAGIKLPPNYGAEYREPFEQAFVDLADELGIAFLPFLMEDVWNEPGSMQPDGIHPTAQGHERIALNVLKVLEPLLIEAGEQKAALPAS